MYRGIVAQAGYDLTISAMLIELSKNEEELNEFARQVSCFIYHYVECKKILRQSINQVIHGFYNIGNSLLRNFFECHLRGLFLNQLALICREEGKKMAFKPSMNEIVGDLVDRAQRSRQYRLTMERSIGIVKVVSKLDLHLGFKEIVDQFNDWGFLKPYPNYPSFRRSVRYGKLSEYTHETEKTLDFFKNVISDSPDYQEIDEEQLDQYMNDLCCVVDGSIVTMLNFFNTNYPDAEWVKSTVNFLRNEKRFKDARLNNTSNLLKNLEN